MYKHKILIKILIKIILILSVSTNDVWSQSYSNTEISKMIEKYKNDQRGPYKAIRWFCPDGTTVPPDQRCPVPGGVQRAQYKDEVLSLAKNKNIYIGQILAATDFEDFWDGSHNNSRAKQYIVEKYLKAADNGWVLRKAKFYRGAFQAEDEQEWGVNFLGWLVQNDENIETRYFLVRNLFGAIPHKGDTKNDQLIRAISKSLSDTIPSFMNLRVKIHGHPEASDIIKVQEFKDQNIGKISQSQKKQIDQLILEMKRSFTPVDLKSLNKYTAALKKDSPLQKKIDKLVSDFTSGSFSNTKSKLITISNLMLKIREELLLSKSAKQKIALIDLSLIFEDILFHEIDSWEIVTVSDLIEKNYYLAQALVGTGHLELWEWNKIKNEISLPLKQKVSLEEFSEISEYAKRIVEWGSSLTKAVFQDEIALFEGFEPLVQGFLDDNIRSSILLQQGNLLNIMSTYKSKISGISSSVLNIPAQGSIRGLNPGYAFGELVVLKGSVDEIEFKNDKIYVFEHPPADLKPVAGIVTISEGNPVSHIQLLARNLGIPNSIISIQNLNDLQKHSGEKVFYAVSRKGTVIMKSEENMNADEKNLFAKKGLPNEVIEVPVDKLKLNVKNVLNIKMLKSKDSGVLCGPKAANLGQLKSLFPEKVAEGIVIPFGIFRDHMSQTIQGEKITYWDYLNNTFTYAGEMRKQNKKNNEIEGFVLGRLKELQSKIRIMPLKEDFVEDIENNFITVLGNSLGKVPVFIRSDTNMEDLKDFTGAGLNLTLFNVLEKDKILNGIKEVWASPFSERSYRWRQKLLTNPENVYPSILIIPTINVDKSGVMITTGVNTDDPTDISVSFSRGAGGAVEGQAAESYIIKRNGISKLISPARESKFNTLPSSGGSGKGVTYFNKPLLESRDLDLLKKIGEEMKNKLPGSPGVESSGPYDIELGFKDGKIWLFQVRPFVESKKAQSSAYLNSINKEVKEGTVIDLKSIL